MIKNTESALNEIAEIKEDIEDLKDLRFAKEQDKDSPNYSFEEVKRILNLE